MMKMKAAVFIEPGRIVLDEKPIPDIGPLDALVRITTTTSCGTDLHILKGEYPVERGLTIGHEPVGVIEKPGSAVQGYREGQRAIAGAITPSGYSNARFPLGPFAAGLADTTIVTTLCRGGKERMRRLMAAIASRRVDLKPLVTHRFKLDEIEAAYDLFGHQRDGVLKVAIIP